MIVIFDVQLGTVCYLFGGVGPVKIGRRPFRFYFDLGLRAHNFLLRVGAGRCAAGYMST